MAKPRKAVTKKPAKARASKRAKAPTKDETVETSTGVQLLLGNLPSDRDALHAFETLARLKDKSKTAAGHVSDQKKKMKESGLDVKAFEEIMRLERADPLDVAAQLREMQRLARLRGLPIQIGLFETKYKSVEDQAFAMGYADGKAGRPANESQWPEEAPGNQDYHRGWQEGQKDMVLGKSDDAEAEDE